MSQPNTDDTIETVLLSDINIGVRFRKDYGNLAIMEDSIEELGLIHPIILRKNADGSLDLMAGGRRTQALLNLDHKELFHGTTCDPQRPGFLYKEEVPDDILRQVELDENMARKAMTWQEEVLLIAETHELKKRKANAAGERWGQRETGVLFKQSLGHINNVLKIAELLRSEDKAIVESADIYDAVRVLLMRKQDEAVKARLKMGLKPTDVLGGVVTDKGPMHALPEKIENPTKESGLLKDIFIDQLKSVKQSCSVTEHHEDEPMKPSSLDTMVGDMSSNALAGVEGVLETDRSEATEEMTMMPEIQLSKMFRCVDSRLLMEQLPEGAFRHIVTDPPYAIDLGNMETFQDMDRVEETHDVEENLELLEFFIPHAFRVLKDDGWLVMWCDYMHFRQLHDWGAKAGFKVTRWPVVWHKTHTCRNSAPSFNPTKNTEIMIWMRKGLATLKKPLTTSVISAESATERRMYNNPFAKPASVWAYIYEAIATPGDTVWDPFCGEMSASRAAVIAGLLPYGTEIDEKHYNRGIEHMKTIYRSLTKNKARFT